MLSPEQIAMQLRIELLKVLPDVIRESVKPMEQIDDIKIIQVDGLNGENAGSNGGDTSSNGGGNLADQVVSRQQRIALSRSGTVD